jgi:hypothetical protein
MPVLRAPDERFLAGFDKISEIFPGGTDGVFVRIAHNIFSAIQDEQRRFYFAEGRALFYMETLGAINAYRDMEDDFGFVPMPKQDEHQERHWTWTGSAIPMMVIPRSVPDLERTGIIANALSAISTDTTSPAYHDITIQRKAVRDEESLASIAIMRDTVIYDIGLIYGWNQLMAGYRSALEAAAGESPLTTFERLEGTMTTNINRTLEELRR